MAAKFQIRRRRRVVYFNEGSIQRGHWPLSWRVSRLSTDRSSTTPCRKSFLLRRKSGSLSLPFDENHEPPTNLQTERFARILVERPTVTVTSTVTFIGLELNNGVCKKMMTTVWFLTGFLCWAIFIERNVPNLSTRTAHPSVRRVPLPSQRLPASLANRQPSCSRLSPTPLPPRALLQQQQRLRPRLSSVSPPKSPNLSGRNRRKKPLLLESSLGVDNRPTFPISLDLIFRQRGSETSGRFQWWDGPRALMEGLVCYVRLFLLFFYCADRSTPYLFVFRCCVQVDLYI